MYSELESDPLAGRDLAAFVATVEAASFQGAADTLGLTQSAVSKRVAALERRTGACLLERGRNGAQPTAAGRVLYPEAKHALSALARAATVVAECGAGDVHLLRVAASHTIGEFLVPGWLAGFRAADGDPQLRVEVDIANSPAVLGQLRSGAVALGFVEGVDALVGFESVVTTRDELTVVVAAEHAWVDRDEIAPAELAGEPYLARERDSGTRAVVAEALGRHGVELSPAFETTSIQGLKRAVLDGGFTVLSSLAVEGELRSGALRAVEVADVRLARELRAVRIGPLAADSPAQRLWSWLGTGSVLAR